MSDTKDQTAPAAPAAAGAAAADKPKSPTTAKAAAAEPAKPTIEPAAPAEEEEDEAIIDMETFQQIMDMDEDDDEDGEDKHSFSKGIVWGYFTQAEDTFVEMQEALDQEDLTKLSSLGHFLKGSSAALGIVKVQGSCEQMQHYGNLRDEEAGTDLKPEEALARIKGLLAACKKDYEAAKKWMKKLYEEE
ncbi:hypothetical protein IAT38_007260 [Cryptococcus sp. DSM 104549]